MDGPAHLLSSQVSQSGLGVSGEDLREGEEQKEEEVTTNFTWTFVHVTVFFVCALAWTLVGASPGSLVSADAVHTPP